MVAAVAAAAVALALALASGASANASTAPVSAQLRAAARAMRVIEARLAPMQRSAARFADWQACITPVPIREYGDPDGRYGYRYNERDGTGIGYRPALAVDPAHHPRRDDYLFLNFARSGECESAPTQPGGTAEPAVARRASRPRDPSPPHTPAADTSARRTPPQPTLARLTARVRHARATIRQLRASAARFDSWESCVSWIPVTEYGDPERHFGYLFGHPGDPTQHYRPAIAIDRSDWDDPDYMFLAFVDGNRPGQKCTQDPGEAPDLRRLVAPICAPGTACRAAPAPPPSASARHTLRRRIDHLQDTLATLSEDAEDLLDPIAEFDLFDQCMFTIGVDSNGSTRPHAPGYSYGPHRARRSALAMGLRQTRPPTFQFLAFPQEEPPSIECNEDAEPEPTDS
jgi:hypothetical protein